MIKTNLRIEPRSPTNQLGFSTIASCTEISEQSIESELKTEEFHTRAQTGVQNQIKASDLNQSKRLELRSKEIQVEGEGGCAGGASVFLLAGCGLLEEARGQWCVTGSCYGK